MNNVLVSIVTPSLNQGNFIEQTIESVVNQTYDNIEYIIMDGGSTDNTVDIIRKYRTDLRIKLFIGDDKGQYDAVNKGFMIAKGEILGWINADDVYVESAVERIVRAFRDYAAADIIYGKFYHMDEDSKILREKPAMPYSLKWLRRYCFINPSVTFIRSSLIHHDGFLIDNSITDYGDWDWFLRIAEAGKQFYFLPEFLGHFRMHPNSKIARMDKTKVYQERLMISRRHNIPLNYINLWADLLMPWRQRVEYCAYLLKRKDWRGSLNRITANAKRVCKNSLKKMV